MENRQCPGLAQDRELGSLTSSFRGTFGKGSSPAFISLQADQGARACALLRSQVPLESAWAGLFLLACRIAHLDKSGLVCFLNNM